MRKTQLLLMVMMSALAFASAIPAFSDDIRLGMPGYGGSGCPAGTVAATLSPDQKALSLIFDTYIAEAGGDTRKALDRKNCQVAIPVHVPQGFSFSIIQMDYRGFNALPWGGTSQFNVEYFLAYPGSPVSGPRYSKRWRGPLNEDYLLSNALGLQAVTWSPCGQDVNLRTNTSMMVMTNARRELAMSTVDSIDTKASILYQLQWRRCN